MIDDVHPFFLQYRQYALTHTEGEECALVLLKERGNARSVVALDCGAQVKDVRRRLRVHMIGAFTKW